MPNNPPPPPFDAGLFKVAFDAATDPIFIITREGFLYYINPAGAAAMARTPEELVGKHQRELFPPSVAELNESSFRTVIETGNNFVGEELIPLPTGTRWIEVHLNPLRNQQGEITHVLGISRDITKRRLTEQKLAKSEQTLATVGRMAPDAIILMNSAGKITGFNKQAEKIFGIPDSSAIGQDLHALLVSEKFHTAYLAGLEHFRRTGQGPAIGRTLELVAKRASGEEFPIEISLSAMYLDDEWHAIGFARDISARKLAEEELTNRERFLNVTLNSIADGVIVTDQRGNITRMNPIAEELTGWTEEEARGRPVDEIYRIIHEKTREPLDHPVTSVLRDGLAVGLSDHTLLISKDGQEHPVINSGAPIRLEKGGALSGTILVFHDVSHESEQRRKIEESEEQFRGAFESMTAGLALADLSGRFTRVNQKMVEILGYDCSELIGCSLIDLTHPDDRKASTDCMTQLLQGVIRQQRLEKRYAHKKGHYVWVELTAGAVRDPSGKALRLCAQIVDITEKRQAEESRRKSEEKYRLMFETSLDAIFIADADAGIILDCNSAAVHLLRKPRERIIGMHQRDIHPPDPNRTASFSTGFVYHRSGNDGVLLNSKVLTGTGEIRDVVIQANSFEWNGRKVLQGIFRDITEQLALERKRRDEYRFRSSLLNVIPIPVFFKDADYRFLGCNKAYEQLSGKTETQIFGKTVDEIAPPEIAEVYRRRDTDLLAMGGTQTYESKFRSADDSLRDIVFHKAVFHDSDGRPAGIVGAIVDMTDVHQAERERTKIQAQLIHSSKLASIGTLAAGVAHEINNPLTIIKGNLSILQGDLRKLGISGDPITMLGKQNHAVDRIAAIVNSLRAYARADTNIVEPIDIHKVVQDTLSMCSVIYKKARVSIEPELQARNPVVDANMGKLQQVLMNLLSNAKDATEALPQGGAIKVQTLDDEKHLLLRVSDNGTGIARDVLSHIFDPFFTTKPQGKGTGLGLAISHSIIESLHGTISVESEPGIGTTFTVCLPRSAQGLTEKEAVPQEGCPKLSGSALVVDDEADIRGLLIRLLREFGLSTKEADDGSTALELLQRERFDFVITDLKMPRMNGDALLEAAQRIPHLSGTKYLVITGGIVTDCTDQQRDTVRKLAHGCVRKPFDKGMIAQALIALQTKSGMPVEMG